MPLLDELQALPAPLLQSLRERGFDAPLLDELATRHVLAATNDTNRVHGIVTPPTKEDLKTMPTAGSAEYDHVVALGEAFFRQGKVALVVMAGGMATRMGGVVKALVEVFDGKTFLDLRLLENAAFERTFGAKMPLWLMTSSATDGPIHAKLNGAPPHIATFEQGLSLRLTEKGGLFRDASGEPSSCATGHGDLIDALRRSGLLRSFVENGGEYVWIANVDNLGATPDPAILGMLVASGAEVLVEVCKKEPGDRGGIPVRLDGKPQILEEFRLPEGFDPKSVDVFNTNTFVVKARALLETDIDWTWFKVEKKVDGIKVLQFERLIQEVAAALPSTFLTVPRDGDSPRFLPVKDNDELARRKEAIAALATCRGWLSAQNDHRLTR